MADRLRIASFNANSIRNRLETILNWMNENECDVVCVQETKCVDENFPLDIVTDSGFYCAFKGQKTFNGVAIISREPIEDVKIGLDREPEDQEARIVRARVRGVNIINTYIPQGTSTDSPRFPFKLQWIRGMRDYLERDFVPDDYVIWAGDFNVAREPVDVYDPDGLFGGVCYHPNEHAALDYVMEWGLVDVFRMHHPGEPNNYTFWDYRVPNALKRRLGWRLDYIMASRPLAEKCTNSWIDQEPRLREKPSDHTFIAADFELD